MPKEVGQRSRRIPEENTKTGRRYDGKRACSTLESDGPSQEAYRYCTGLVKENGEAGGSTKLSSKKSKARNMITARDSLLPEVPDIFGGSETFSPSGS